MTPPIVRALVAVAAAWTVATAPAAAQPPPLQLLDVPYLPQSEELCGGAAAAMVMRYWGETGIFAESFADLVDRTAGGIRGSDLIRSLETRGWRPVSLAGDLPLLVSSLEARRPPIALIEDRPGRFHYVVIVGLRGDRVVLHDPARAPFRVFERDAFVRAWRASGFWTLVVLPGLNDSPRAGGPHVTGGTSDSAPVDTACAAMVSEGVRLARDGAVNDAEALLHLASSRCPNDEAPWRELAGVHALRKDWRRAAVDARRALARNAEDEHAARILATSLYLEGDTLGALDAWNLVDEPIVDIVDIRGLERTRFAVAADMLRLAPGTELTSRGLSRAARRLDELPSAFGSRVSYAPADDGLAVVTAAVIERPLLPSSPLAAAPEAIAALASRELRVNLASPTGGGELWYGAWRWWDARPRVAFGLTAPAPFGGTWGIDVSDERETYGAAGRPLEERRRRAGVRVADWGTHALRWEAGFAVERWATGTASSFHGSVRQHAGQDRLILQTRVAAWVGQVRTWSAGGSIDWRSRRANERTVWLGRGAVESAGRGAPLSLMAGAGTGHARDALLRAHPLLHDGVIRDGVFGRTVMSATAEWRRWLPPVFRVVRIAPAVFADAARAYRAPDFADDRAHVDVGAGFRVAFPGSGTLRVDIARGLRDRRIALSIAFSR